jgi:hypothetical protein
MPRHLLIQGLTWEPAGSSGVLEVVHGTEGRFDVEILNNRFVGITGGTAGSLVTVSTGGTPLPGPLGPIALSLAGNEFDVPSDTETNPVALSFTSALAGTVRVEGNTVRTADQRQQSAIDLYHTEGELAVEVERNVIASANPEQSGVNAYQNGDGSGRIVARVFDNLITGFDGGMRFGVSFYASAGTIDLTVLHNTVVSASLRAVQVGGREDLGGHASGIIANNVLVFSERSDVGIHQFRDTVMERRNLVTHIGGPDDAPEAPSPDDIVVTDPQFVGPDDYRLEPTSLGINTASIELLPEDIVSDLDRNPRVAGPAPDMGAYELPCEPDSTEPQCVKQPSCEETGCTTDDPCFPARCINDQCVVVEPIGVEHARCACDRPTPSSCPSTPLLKSVRRRASRACTYLERAATTTSPSLYPRLLTSAQQAFERAILGVDRRAMLGQISATCAVGLRGRLHRRPPARLAADRVDVAPAGTLACARSFQRSGCPGSGWQTPRHRAGRGRMEVTAQQQIICLGGPRDRPPARRGRGRLRARGDDGLARTSSPPWPESARLELQRALPRICGIPADSLVTPVGRHPRRGDAGRRAPRDRGARSHALVPALPGRGPIVHGEGEHGPGDTGQPETNGSLRHAGDRDRHEWSCGEPQRHRERRITATGARRAFLPRGVPPQSWPPRLPKKLRARATARLRGATTERTPTPARRRAR